ncbi:siderophore-interacting protein [Nonomuraea sp. NPDC046570]|uniref:siderophore-interacting protein n=1 Tax=Nonomuraea sp. NPDC046570 TaxID=3155255 RepID=UPI0033D61F6B
MSEPLVLRVRRTAQIAPHFVRVTLGDGDIARFTPMGYDQWFRLFIPVPGKPLPRLPDKLTMASYLRYLTISKQDRPILRSYSVRAYRAEGPEIDVDFVLHDPPAGGTPGSAASWAQTCRPGDQVAILDEGVTFNPPADTTNVLLVADESGLPAIGGILASLPRDVSGRALVEVPSPADVQELDPPPGVTVDWVIRDDPHALPGRAVLAAAEQVALPDEPTFGWVVGEQALPVALRRHWIAAGLPKDRIVFCGYWRAGRG